MDQKTLLTIFITIDWCSFRGNRAPILVIAKFFEMDRNHTMPLPPGLLPRKKIVYAPEDEGVYGDCSGGFDMCKICFEKEKVSVLSRQNMSLSNNQFTRLPDFRK